MNWRLGVGGILVVLLGCRDEGPVGPTAPPLPAQNAALGADRLTGASAGGTLAGTVVNAVTGAPVAGARVTVGASVLTTGQDGSFQLEPGGGGASYRVVVEADRYFRRDTQMRPATSDTGGFPPVTLELLPEGDDFDLRFFDHVFREVGAAGTHPWMFEPEFEIWRRVFRCTGFVAESPCDELTALDTVVPDAFEAMAREVIGNDAHRYTDGHVVGSRITTRLHPPGTVLSRSAYIERGKIVFALVSRDDNFSWAFWRYASDDAMVGGHVHLNRKHIALRGVFSHELAHTLGFAHPLGLDEVPRESIMRRGHGEEPTRFDMLHGRILYHRPPGSRTPDVDPPDYLLNGLRDRWRAGGGGTTVSAP